MPKGEDPNKRALDQAKDAAPAKPRRSAKRPAPRREGGAAFKMDPVDGLWLGKLRLADPFLVDCEAYDPVADRFGLVMRWRDRHGAERRRHIPRGDLAAPGTPWLRDLMDGGLAVEIGRKNAELIAKYLAQVEPEHRAFFAGRCGWFLPPAINGAGPAWRAFVLPDETIAPKKAERIVFDAGPSAATFAMTGTAKGWHAAIGAVAQQQSRLILAIGAALAGPLLSLMNEEGGVIHLRGGSSIGKSLALRVAASVFGAEIRPWRATANALEGLCLLHNDNLLLLDEVGQGAVEDVSAAAYAITNGRGKARMRADRHMDPPPTWRAMVLSSGEIGLAELMAGERRRAMVGQQIRFLDIGADAGAGLGVFDTLADFTTGSALAEHLRTATGHHAGHVGRAFVRALVDESNLPGLVERLEDWRREWIAANVAKEADGQVRRAAARFAVLHVALRYAIARGVLPWPRERIDWALARCWEAWIEARGGIGSGELMAVMERLQGFVAKHGAARFQVAVEGAGIGAEESKWRVQDRAGFILDGLRGVSVERLYLFFPSSWKQDIVAGADMKTINRQLVEQGVLVGGGGRHAARTVRVGGTIGRYYCVDPGKLAGADDGAEA